MENERAFKEAKPFHRPKMSERFLSYIDEINRLSVKDACPDWVLREHSALCHFMEMGVDAYTLAAMLAAGLGFEQVVDIGCYNAFQSDLFESVGVKYLGLEIYPTDRMWTSNYDSIEYPNTSWKHLIDCREKTLAISHLCVGSQITGRPAYEAIARDFDHLLIAAQEKCIAEFQTLYGFGGVRVAISNNMKDCWIYFVNRKKKT